MAISERNERGKPSELTILRMPDGGFVIVGCFERGTFTPHLFASTTIEEALKYIKSQLAPPAPGV